MMSPHFSIRVIWQDDDIVEIEAEACNPHFFGCTQVYTTYDELRAFSQALCGFPGSSSSRTSFTAGKPGSYSFLKADFYRINRVGHTATLITIESNVPTEWRPEEKDRIRLEMQFEAAALDNFVKALDRLIVDRSGQAVLQGIPPHIQNIPSPTME